MELSRKASWRKLGLNCPRLSRSRKANGKFIVQGPGGILSPRDSPSLRAPEVGTHWVKRTVSLPFYILPIDSCATRSSREDNCIAFLLEDNSTLWHPLQEPPSANPMPLQSGIVKCWKTEVLTRLTMPSQNVISETRESFEKRRGRAWWAVQWTRGSQRDEVALSSQTPHPSWTASTWDTDQSSAVLKQ